MVARLLAVLLALGLSAAYWVFEVNGWHDTVLDARDLLATLQGRPSLRSVPIDYTQFSEPRLPPLGQRGGLSPQGANS